MIIFMKYLKFDTICPMLVLLALLLAGGGSAEVDRRTETRDWLGGDSVVMVCGAASHVGSEVALALHRTYSPKKLILVDDLTYIDSSETLNRFEHQRQRLFRVLQEVSTSNTGEAIFYRVDLRPEVPEFIDSSVVPVLPFLLKQHPDITHIVYIPEEKRLDDRIEGNPRAIMMHALLDHLRQWENITGRADLPQFTYASSFEVYSGNAAASLSGIYRGREDLTITEAPVSLEGSAYLLDEILAQTYYNSYKIDSVGLRLFTVYGPFGTPQTLITSIFDHAVHAGPDQTSFYTLPNPASQAGLDLVYIDDAVDAVMTAMQLRPPPQFGPLVVNVGSGQTTSISDVINIINAYIPGTKFKVGKTSPQRSTKADIIAHMDRAKDMLGWEPRVSPAQGILKTLGWHFDRLHPRGRTSLSNQENGDQNEQSWKKVALAGRLGCDIFDDECLLGNKVYPCASECAHREQCFPSYWDYVALESRRLSSQCKEVWYTIALNPDLTDLPSVKLHVSTQSRSHLPGCSFAFVSDSSPLVQRIRNGKSREELNALEYDFWVLIPVSLTPNADTDKVAMAILPKLTPVGFFAEGVELALYTDPHIIMDDLPTLLAEARMHPYDPKVPGVTGLLIGRGRKEGSTRSSTDKYRARQTMAHRMIHIKALGYLSQDKDGFGLAIDSSFLVHRFTGADSSAFRCNILEEVWSWKVPTDRDAISFIGGLHDMWSQVMIRPKEPWWNGDKVETVVEDSRQTRRRLDEADTVVRGPLQYHHFLQNHIASDENEPHEEFHRFDENGLIIRKEKRGLPAQHKQQTETGNEVPTAEESGFVVAVESNRRTWLGIVSLGRVKQFVRLVDAEQFGVVDLSSLYDHVPRLVM